MGSGVCSSRLQPRAAAPTQARPCCVQGLSRARVASATRWRSGRSRLGTPPPVPSTCGQEGDPHLALVVLELTEV